MRVRLAVVLFSLFGLPGLAVAQKSKFVGQLRPGGCLVRVELANGDVFDGLVARESEVDDAAFLRLREVRKTSTGIEAQLVVPIQPIQTLFLRVRRDGKAVDVDSAHVNVSASEWPDQEPCEDDDTNDRRPRIIATVDLGWLATTFAGNVPIEGKANLAVSEASGRFLAAPELQLSPFRSSKLRGSALWIETRVIYSVGEDVSRASIPPPEDFPGLVADATTVEVYTGVRAEAWTIGSKNPMRLFVMYNVGQVFLIETGDGKARTNTRLTAGLRAIGGKFRGTGFEAGLSKNELMTVDHGAALKLWTMSAQIVYAPGGIADQLSVLQRSWPSARFFFRVDTDPKKGVDFLRTSFGLSYDFSSLAGGFIPAGVR